MLPYLATQLVEHLSATFDLPLDELTNHWESIQTDFFQERWAKEKAQHMEDAVFPPTPLTDDVIIRLGPEKSPPKTKLAIFYAHSLIHPVPEQNGYSHQDVWEWTYPNLATDLKEYLKDPTYHLILVANETVDWKIQTLMTVAMALLPPNGNLTILIGVNNPFPLTTLFEKAYPGLTWKDAIVVGRDEYDTYLGHLLGINYCFASSYDNEPKSTA